jgi:hypothetical protein
VGVCTFHTKVEDVAGPRLGIQASPQERWLSLSNEAYAFPRKASKPGKSAYWRNSDLP